MTATKNVQLRLNRFIVAKREQVFQAWIKPSLMQQWFCPVDMTVSLAEADPRVGGRYKVQMKKSSGELHTTYGVYREIILNEKLVFTWGWEGPDRYETLVTIELRDKDNGTELLLIHERFADQAAADHHAQGWRSCLDNLAAGINDFA
jgi:uncharacterized protein YndB with AHSA1/START domain